MGEIAEAVVSGAMCQTCGEFFEDGDVGYPRTCDACKFENRQIKATTPKIACPTCGRKVKEAGLADHQRDVHAK